MAWLRAERGSWACLLHGADCASAPFMVWRGCGGHRPGSGAALLGLVPPRAQAGLVLLAWQGPDSTQDRDTQPNLPGPHPRTLCRGSPLPLALRQQGILSLQGKSSGPQVRPVGSSQKLPTFCAEKRPQKLEIFPPCANVSLNCKKELHVNQALKQAAESLMPREGCH